MSDEVLLLGERWVIDRSQFIRDSDGLRVLIRSEDGRTKWWRADDE